MSYKALLFCPDEKIVRAVTQVLSELDFTVEPAGDVFNAAKKLADEHFDALVVDSQNEKDASVLFKAARNSSVNHSSLYVAVVEGQAGVATAFRIGANLVLTKPINIEQSKGTLRVARGLLRKNDARAAAAPAPGTTAINSPEVTPRPELFPPPPLNPRVQTSGAPFSMIEVENEPTPTAEAAEVAVLESLPDAVAGKHASAVAISTPELKSSAEPIAASTVAGSGGQAAAVAMAPIKPAVELKTAAPLATQEAITADANSPEAFEVAPVPTFSSYADASQVASKGHALRNIAFLVLLVGTGYAAWQKFQPMQYLHGSDSGSEKPVETPAPIVGSPVIAEPQVSVPANEAGTTASTSATDVNSRPTPPVHLVPDHYVAPETIDVGDTSASPKPNITITPKAQPIVVKTKPASSSAQRTPSQAPPPAFAIAAANPDAALAKLVTTDAVLPKPAQSSNRVSQGVSQGLLIKKISPVYPPSALQLRKQGAVELLATVSKQGTITAIKVLSGDSSLAKSASDAVRQWKYRPYLLNGEPVEIETQVTINFKLPN
jgi:TonB family protein